MLNPLHLDSQEEIPTSFTCLLKQPHLHELCAWPTEVGGGAEAAVRLVGLVAEVLHAMTMPAYEESLMRRVQRALFQNELVRAANSNAFWVSILILVTPSRFPLLCKLLRRKRPKAVTPSSPHRSKLRLR
jgi:hypothetical protein